MRSCRAGFIAAGPGVSAVRTENLSDRTDVPSAAPLLPFRRRDIRSPHPENYGQGVMSMKVILAAMVVALAVAATASASTGDPRKCAYGPARKADCARDAAKLVARKVLQRRVGQAYPWQGPMTCTAAGSLLKWRCSFTAQFPHLPPKGYVAVTFAATSTGWHVRAAIVSS